jgi:hypothetical protein
LSSVVSSGMSVCELRLPLENAADTTHSSGKIANSTAPIANR